MTSTQMSYDFHCILKIKVIHFSYITELSRHVNICSQKMKSEIDCFYPMNDTKEKNNFLHKKVTSQFINHNLTKIL